MSHEKIKASFSTDALVQPVHLKDEFRAFCDMVDRHGILPDTKDVFIGDRGYCSYNNMAHVTEKGQYFLFRTKDIHSKGLAGNFDFPDTDSFDVQVNVTLVRSHKREAAVQEGFYKRYVNVNASFDYYMKAIFQQEVKEKKKRKNHDLTVAGYKVTKEEEKIEKLSTDKMELQADLLVLNHKNPPHRRNWMNWTGRLRQETVFGGCLPRLGSC